MKLTIPFAQVLEVSPPNRPPGSFEAGNIELFVPRRHGTFAKLRKLHHKVMVIDELIVVAGSFNYTEPANEFNDEYIFVLGSTRAEVAGVGWSEPMSSTSDPHEAGDRADH